MPLNPGKIDNSSYSGSMAEAIENAFKKAWPSIMNSNLSPTSDQMKLLFIAIAQGVVKHLKENANSFKITIQTSVNHTHPGSITIETSNML